MNESTYNLKRKKIHNCKMNGYPQTILRNLPKIKPYGTIKWAHQGYRIQENYSIQKSIVFLYIALNIRTNNIYSLKNKILRYKFTKKYRAWILKITKCLLRNPQNQGCLNMETYHVHELEDSA